jgi:hypothetical protein
LKSCAAQVQRQVKILLGRGNETCDLSQKTRKRGIAARWLGVWKALLKRLNQGFRGIA